MLKCSQKSLLHTIIQKLRELDAQPLLDASDLFVHGECLDVQMSMIENGASWGLVDT